MANLTVRLEPPDTLVLQGEFDMAEVDAFDRAASGWLEGRPADHADLTLDLSGLSFIDSFAIRSFLRLSKALAPGRLILDRPRSMVAKVLDITAFSACPNVEVRAA